VPTVGPAARMVPELVPELVAALRRRGETLATAESLTGGALASALVDVPGVSAVLRGGIVAYASELKHELLGVDAGLLAREGAVHPEVARQMADGVRARLDATWGLATTGVAGPDPQDGKPAGTVHIAVAGSAGAVARSLHLPGDRPAVRAATTAAVLQLLAATLGVQPWA
jgi:nicotinamide-nucleotide amidase